MMETDPTKINDADRRLAASIEALGEFAGASNKRQKAENKLRSENRAKVKELGVGTYAYQIAIKICKDMTESERKEFLRDLDILVKILGPKQKDFFADDLIKAELRAKKRQDAASKEGRTDAELNAKTDTDPKSDPKKGGAGKVLAPEAAAAEQAEGDAVLEAGIAGAKSQSEIAKDKRAKAGLN